MHVDKLGGVVATFYGDPHDVGRASKSDAFNRFSVCISDCHNFRSQNYGATRRASILVPAVPTLYQNLQTLPPAVARPRQESTEAPVRRAIARLGDGRRVVIERSIAGG
jgi:hypothetical protein